MNTQDTICAIATAQGGAIGVIRISGKDAIAITDRIFTPVGKHPLPLSERKAYTMAFGHIRQDDGEIIDEVLIGLFKSPHSYTGEDCVEISCHGSSFILQQVMQLLIRKGCRAAGPGEFTQRAFLNGKMDLSQAEAVADLIASSSAVTHRMAMNQMRGGFSRELSALRERLLHLTSLMELELDFSDHEELEFADRSELETIAGDIEKVISGLVHSFSVGNVLKNGIPVAIVGETNAGKSTLLNTLLNEEKAIVSDIHGTTRDVIEDTVNLSGITFRFIDTAGIRDTHDTIENMGIARSFHKMEPSGNCPMGRRQYLCGSPNPTTFAPYPPSLLQQTAHHLVEQIRPSIGCSNKAIRLARKHCHAIYFCQRKNRYPRTAKSPCKDCLRTRTNFFRPHRHECETLRGIITGSRRYPPRTKRTPNSSFR